MGQSLLARLGRGGEGGSFRVDEFYDKKPPFRQSRKFYKPWVIAVFPPLYAGVDSVIQQVGKNAADGDV